MIAVGDVARRLGKPIVVLTVRNLVLDRWELFEQILFESVFVESLHHGDDAHLETRAVVEQLFLRTGQPVSATDFGRELGISKHIAYLKLRRRGSFDFPILGVAAALDIDDRGECRDATVVLTAVASAPKTVIEATSLLQGKKITLELIDAVADAAAKIAHPLDNADLDYWYRKRMAKVYTQRALAQVAGIEERSTGVME